MPLGLPLSSNAGGGGPAPPAPAVTVLAKGAGLFVGAGGNATLGPFIVPAGHACLAAVYPGNQSFAAFGEMIVPTANQLRWAFVVFADAPNIYLRIFNDNPGVDAHVTWVLLDCG